MKSNVFICYREGGCIEGVSLLCRAAACAAELRPLGRSSSLSRLEGAVLAEDFSGNIADYENP